MYKFYYVLHYMDSIIKIYYAKSIVGLYILLCQFHCVFYCTNYYENFINQLLFHILYSIIWTFLDALSIMQILLYVLLWGYYFTIYDADSIVQNQLCTLLYILLCVILVLLWMQNLSYILLHKFYHILYYIM